LEKTELDQFTVKRDRILLDLSRILRKEIHLVVLNTAGEGLLNQVVRKGICIFTGNKKKQTLFIARALLRIADFNYCKNIMQTGFVRNVLEIEG